MKIKATVCLFVTLLMVVSAYSAGSMSLNTCDGPTGGGPVENLEVTKKVWNGEDWVDEYVAELGEKVTFNITITYSADCGYKATNIVSYFLFSFYIIFFFKEIKD